MVHFHFEGKIATVCGLNVPRKERQYNTRVTNICSNRKYDVLTIDVGSTVRNHKLLTIVGKGSPAIDNIG